MEFKEYQELALQTWGGPQKKRRAVFALVSEVGEVIGKIEKKWRTDYAGNEEKFKEQVSKEIGDTLYYIAVLAYEFNFNITDYTPLSEVVDVTYADDYEVGLNTLIDELAWCAYYTMSTYNTSENDRLIQDEDEDVILGVYNSLRDLTWYLCLDIQEIANQNIAKLKDRAERNMIKGSGDER